VREREREREREEFVGNIYINIIFFSFFKKNKTPFFQGNQKN
jgi:hypothetical protein